MLILLFSYIFLTAGAIESYRERHITTQNFSRYTKIISYFLLQRYICAQKGLLRLAQQPSSMGLLLFQSFFQGVELGFDLRGEIIAQGVVIGPDGGGFLKPAVPVDLEEPV